MKRYLYLLLILIVPFLSVGAIQNHHTAVLSQYNAAGGAASVECDDGCDGVSDADLFCEDMDGTGKACTWSDTGTVNWDSTTGLSALSCSTKGDNVLEITTASTESDYTSHSESAATDVYDVFYVRVSSTDVDTDGEHQLLAWFSSGVDVICGLYLYYDTDHYEFQFSIDGSRQSCPTTISLNTWYKIERQYDAGVAVRFWLDDVLEKEDTSITESDSVTTYVFGDNSGDSATTFQVCINKADATAMPGTCGG